MASVPRVTGVLTTLLVSLLHGPRPESSTRVGLGRLSHNPQSEHSTTTCGLWSQVLSGRSDPTRGRSRPPDPSCGVCDPSCGPLDPTPGPVSSGRPPRLGPSPSVHHTPRSSPNLELRFGTLLLGRAREGQDGERHGRRGPGRCPDDVLPLRPRSGPGRSLVVPENYDWGPTPVGTRRPRPPSLRHAETRVENESAQE